MRQMTAWRVASSAQSRVFTTWSGMVRRRVALTGAMPTPMPARAQLMVVRASSLRQTTPRGTERFSNAFRMSASNLR